VWEVDRLRQVGGIFLFFSLIVVVHRFRTQFRPFATFLQVSVRNAYPVS